MVFGYVLLQDSKNPAKQTFLPPSDSQPAANHLQAAHEALHVLDGSDKLSSHTPGAALETRCQNAKHLLAGSGALSPGLGSQVWSKR